VALQPPEDFGGVFEGYLEEGRGNEGPTAQVLTCSHRLVTNEHCHYTLRKLRSVWIQK
jgi:hypothetical protein